MSPSKPAPTGQDALLALGSNLGDRAGHLGAAVRRLKEAGAELVAASGLYATEAVGIQGGPEFLNAAVRIRTVLGPEDLLALCARIEGKEGRKRTPGRWTSRTLDVDLLAQGEQRRDTPRLTLPHPRLQERAFVLAPLREIAPEWVIAGRTVADWAESVGSAGVVRVGGPSLWIFPS